MKNTVTSADRRTRTKQKDLQGSLPSERPSPPTLRLTPSAWAKLLFLRDAGPTEIGGFGISAVGQPLLVEDVRLVRQRCDWASVVLDDESVADLFDEQIDLGRRPEEFARIWVHTHPGESPSPSATDEETFARVFGGCDWAVMFILAQGGRSYARLRFGVGPGGALEIPVEVDFAAEFSGSDHEAWAAEYVACVEPLERQAAAEPSFRGMEDEDWFGGLSDLGRPLVEEAEYEAYW